MIETGSPYSEVVRVNQIGSGLKRRLEPDAEARRRIARSLELASLDSLSADVEVAPTSSGWRLSGRLRAELAQTCGITLEPLPLSLDQNFSVPLAEAAPDAESDEIVVTLDDEAPDLIEDGRLDLGQYLVEQLALSLDPFPRKPGAEFVQPPEPGEISPFAVLKTLKPSGEG